MVCRMCLDKLSGTQYIISETSWLCDFLHNYCFKDSFNKRDITKGSKNLCESCYKNVLYTKKCKDKFVENQKKLPTSRRKDFKMKQPIYVVEDEAWDDSDNCFEKHIGFNLGVGTKGRFSSHWEHILAYSSTFGAFF